MALTESNTDQFSLQQRYEAAPKQILATGIQALVRLPIDLMRADRAKGWNTAAFISGYQGSPLGGYDRELQSQRKLLDELNIVHVPGLNEELAATSVFGSQTAQTYDAAEVRRRRRASGTGSRPASIAPATRSVMAASGARVARVASCCWSATMRRQSRRRFRRAATPRWSRCTCRSSTRARCRTCSISASTPSPCRGSPGSWVAMKITTPVADGSGMAEVAPGRLDPVLPDFEVDGKQWAPTLSGHVGVPFANTLEIEVLGNRIEWAKRYVAENPLNTFVTNPSDAWLGIVAGGHDMQQVMEALRVLGSQHRARSASSACAC